MWQTSNSNACLQPSRQKQTLEIQVDERETFGSKLKEFGGNVANIRGNAAALKEYAKDSGKSQAAIDSIIAPETNYSFLADGVLIKK